MSRYSYLLALFIILILFGLFIASADAATGSALTNIFSLDTRLVPTIQKITPNSGIIHGGTSVEILGTNFVIGKTTVKFGDKDASDVIVQSSTRLTVAAPASSAGSVDVKVINPGGTSAIFKNGFEYQSPQAEKVTVTASPTSLVADGRATSEIQVTVEASDGFRITDETVTLSANEGQIGETAQHEGNGVYTATYTAGTKVGEVEIKATTSNGKSGTVKLTLKPGPVSSVQISANLDELRADGLSKSTITIIVKDANDNPIEDASVKIQASNGSVTSPAEHQKDGVYTANYTAGTEAGEVNITVTAISGGASVSGQTKLTLTEGPGLICEPASGTVGDTVKVTGSNFGANGKAGKLLIEGGPVKIYAVGDTIVSGDEIYADEKGEFVVTFVIPKRPGGYVKLSVGDAETTLSISAKIKVSPESGKAGTSVSLTGDGFGKGEKIKIDFGKTKNIKGVDSNADGSFEASFVLDVQEPGEKLIVATGASSNISATESFTLEPSVPNSVEASASETTLVADVAQKTTIIISVKDAGGRAVIGANVTLRADLGSVTSPATDNKDGTYSATYTAAKNAGKATVTATAGGKSGSVGITLVAGPAFTVELVAEPDELYADGKSQSAITITVKDKNGNPIGDALVEMRASQGKIASPAEHRKDGDYTTTYTAGAIEGKATITATVSGEGYSIDGKTEIKLTPAPEKILTLHPTKGPVGTVVEATGEGFEPNTEVGKLTINRVETPVFAVGETIVVDGSVWADKDGTFAVRFGIPKRPGGGVIVNVGEGAAKFAIMSRISINPEEGAAGTAIRVEGDGFGGEEPVNVDFGDAKEIATGKTNPDGSFELAFNADVQEPGTKGILAMGAFSGRSAETSFELISSEPATISIEVAPKEIVADGVSTASLAIRAEDADGYGVAGQKVNVVAERGKVGSVTEQGGGDYLATYTSDTKTGIVKITASIGGEITDETEITLKAGAPATITVKASPDSLSADGSSQSTITVMVKDANGNPCADEVVTMELSGVGGTLSNESGESGEKARGDNKGDGTYTVTYTAADEKGTAVIKATTQNGKTPFSGVTEISLSKEPNFVFSCNEPNQNVQLGKPLVYFIDGIGQNGFNLPMKLSLEGDNLPKEVEWEFDPATATPTITEPKVKIQLKLRIPDTIEQGEYNFKVLGMNFQEGEFRHLDLSFTVQKVESDISVIVTTKEIRLNETVTLSGNVILEKDDKRTGMEVKLTYLFGDEVIGEHTASAQGEQREYTDEYVPQKVGEWRVKACWEGDSKYQGFCRETFFTVIKGESKITFSPPLTSPRLGEKVTITGKLSPKLAGEPVSLKITAPDGDAETKSLESDEIGVFRYEMGFDRKGDWTFEATWRGNDNYEPSTDTLIVNAVRELGKAIIVLGGGNETTNRNWVIFNNIAEYVYKIFRRRHLTDDDIFFLSPSEFASNIIDKKTSAEWLEYAITKWAKDEKKVNKYVPLYIYLISHNTEEKFLLVKDNPNVYLTPEMLNDWLSVLPEETPVIIIIEACYSGNFIEKLAYGRPGRVVITSASEDEKAELLGNKASFSKYFFDGIERNRDVLAAFLEALETMSHIPQLKYQLPQLDANGDGIPMLPDEPYANDKYVLGYTDETKRVYIPDNFKSAGEAPEINWVTCAPKSPMGTGTKVTIRAEVAGLKVNRVIASVTPPTYDESKHSNWKATYDELELLDADGDGIYEAEYDKFTLPGDYTIVVTATNPEGDSMPEITILTVEDEKARASDINGDGKVDISDLVLVGSNFGKIGTNIKGDVNDDGKVDIKDLILVGKHFGEICKNAAPKFFIHGED